MGAPNLDSRRRGRPSEISDEALFYRRDTLLGTFEFHWAEIAWELERAKKLDSIRQALQPIPAPRRNEFEDFLFELTEETTFKTLRELRRTRRGLEIDFHKVLPEEEEAKEALENAHEAMKDSRSNAETERLLHRYQRDCFSVKRRRDDLREEIDSTDNALRRKGAYVAQSGLLDFIRSERYRLSPMSYANAMAGLPFITWRQSVSRCIGTKAIHPYLYMYELFLEVKRALDDPPKNAELAIEQVNAYLKKSKRQHDYSIQTLKAECYYLRVAIEAAYSRKPPSTAIPFRVFAEYERRSSSHSQLDQVLAKEERLKWR